jgi:hypothetical protein
MLKEMVYVSINIYYHVGEVFETFKTIYYGNEEQTNSDKSSAKK